MQFAEFYHPSTGWNGKDYNGPVTLIPACGSDSVLPLDGRWRVGRCVNAARKVCIARGYHGFTLNSGSFSNSRQTRALEIVKG